MKTVPLSWIGSHELEARVVNYSASEIQAELDRVLEQRKLDDERRHTGTYRGRTGSLVSTPEFWDRREAVLRKALTT